MNQTPCTYVPSTSPGHEWRITVDRGFNGIPYVKAVEGQVERLGGGITSFVVAYGGPSSSRQVHENLSVKRITAKVRDQETARMTAILKERGFI